MVLLANGEEAKFEKVEIEFLDEPVTVYNFEVKDWHCYFVGEAGVLVHNDSCVNTSGTGNTGGKGRVNSGENATDSVYIPRDASGNPIPLRKQTINGQDIPLPDLAAEGRPHTVLGGKVSSKTGDVYRQSATFPSGTWPTANGSDVPWSEVHWTDHGTSHHHSNPHQHIFEYNPDKGGWIRKGPTKLNP